MQPVHQHLSVNSLTCPRSSDLVLFTSYCTGTRLCFELLSATVFMPVIFDDLEFTPRSHYKVKVTLTSKM